jgi:hypothetical protein
VSTLEYQVDIMIEKDKKLVVELFTDLNQMPQWEKGLKEVITVSGKLFDEGSVGYLVFESGTHHQKMKVTVDKNKLPHQIDLIYEVPGAWNLCQNQFIEKNGQTIWIMDVVFKFEQENDFPKEAFINQTREGMLIFKDFVEKR